jgi:dihydrofolate synthase/folylpolyglutamate synthase
VTYSEAIQFLYSLQLFGANFGLENTLRLAELAGNPQNKLRFIHVAGTNGKGSTCAMLESIYRTTGLRVGLFTSPHLISFRERIQVNREWISETDVVQIVAELREQSRAGISPALDRRDACPTFFEFITVMALRYFAEQQCDLVIWETGLGGRLDATNIVTPLASVITNIGIDHSEWLGDTIKKIAAEKAGIIKPNVPIVTAAKSNEGLEIIEAVARGKNAPFTVVNESQILVSPLNAIKLPLHGYHQQLNAALAIATARVLVAKIPVTDTALRDGLAAVSWPGRMQRVQLTSGQTILLDGAHNAAGAEALRAALQAEFSDHRPTLIFGVFRDKDSRSMCQALAPLANRIVLTPIHSERTEDPAKLVPVFREANPRVSIEVCSSLSEALKKTADDSFVVIAGSLYLIGEAMELLHLGATPSADEKSLNEWSSTPPRAR